MAAGMQTFVNVAIPLFLLCGRPLDLLHVPLKIQKFAVLFCATSFCFRQGVRANYIY